LLAEFLHLGSLLASPCIILLVHFPQSIDLKALKLRLIVHFNHLGMQALIVSLQVLFFFLGCDELFSLSLSNDHLVID
jgi:hypothetical protein